MLVYVGDNDYYVYIEGEVMARIVSIGGKAEDWEKLKKKGRKIHKKVYPLDKSFPKDEFKKLFKQCKDLWSKAVKITYGRFDGDYYYCELCGEPCLSGEGAGTGKGIASHHIEGKQSYTLRFLLINGTPACSSCHTMGKHSAHQDRTVFINKMIEIRGQEWYDKLLKIKGGKEKWTIARMKEKKEELQKIIDS